MRPTGGVRSALGFRVRRIASGVQRRVIVGIETDALLGHQKVPQLAVDAHASDAADKASPGVDLEVAAADLKRVSGHVDAPVERQLHGLAGAWQSLLRKGRQ